MQLLLLLMHEQKERQSMAKISRATEIDAPVEEVYAFMTNPENLPEIWPSMVEVSNVQRSDDGGHSFDWVYKMAGIRFEGHADTTEVEKNRRVVTKNATGIPSTFVYGYEGVGKKTRFKMEVDYTMPSKLLSKVADPFLRKLNEHEADAIISNLKARMELGEKAQPETQPHA
ncbi:MAG: SRPBCC family protein [Polyangiaceae bacterium]|nr:SRPBCC family protein [Polyangiaceae bacterium]